VKYEQGKLRSFDHLSSIAWHLFGLSSEAADLGHRRTGEIPNNHTKLLPKRQRHHHRI